jgi:WD40 repeat protein
MGSPTLSQVLVTLLVGFGGFVLIMLYDAHRKRKQNEEIAEKKLLKDKADSVRVVANKNVSVKPQKVPIIQPLKQKASNPSNKRDHLLFWKEVGGHTTGATYVAFSSRNGLVASSSVDGTVRVILVKDIGQPCSHDVYTNVEGSPTAICFTQNAKRVLVAVQGLIKFYSIVITDSSRKLEHAKNLDTGLNSISTLQVMDVEQWMVLVAGGLDKENRPRVRAFNRKGEKLADFAQIPRRGRADKNRIPLASKALTSVSPDDRYNLISLSIISYHVISYYVISYNNIISSCLSISSSFPITTTTKVYCSRWSW